MKDAELQRICIPPSTSVEQAMRTMNTTGMKILLVVDGGGVLVGTLTDGDIRRKLLRDGGFSGSVAEIMCREYAAIRDTDANVRERARELMIERSIGHVPLVDADAHVQDLLLLAEILEPVVGRQAVPVYDNEVIIMAGGRGTRLDPFTRVLPKPLIPIGERSIIEHIMERFSRCGFHRFTYTLNYKKEYVKLFLKERQFPYDISWVEEPDFLGTAGSLSLLRERVRDACFVVNCDTLLSVDFGDILRWHESHGALLTVVGAHNEVHIPYGVLLHGNGVLECIQEKPNHEVIVNTGMYVMEPEVIARIPDNMKMDMNEVVNMIAKERRVAIYPIHSQDWVDIGQLDEYKHALARLR